MPADAFDPYRAQARLLWHNRWRHWRANPGETLFHAAALLALAALCAGLVGGRIEALQAGLRALWASQPLACAGLALWLVGYDHRTAARRLRQAVADDWFAAQPLSPRQRQRRRMRLALRRLLPQLLLVALVAGLAAATPAAIAGLVLAASAAAATGQWLGRWRYPRPAVGAPRRQLLAAGAATLWRWQWIEASAALTPRQASLLLPAILLVPRGGVSMALAALLLVVALALLQAWRRSLAVLPAAQAWWRSQPRRPRDWWPRALPVPLALLAVGAALLAGVAAPLQRPAFTVVAAAVPVAVGLLQLACTLAWLDAPRRARFAFILHAALLLGLLQALPPLAGPAWLLQLATLLRRGLRR